jgi:hypothetical protein
VNRSFTPAVLALLSALALAACNNPERDRVRHVEGGAPLDIRLPAGLETGRGEYAREIDSALSEVSRFFRSAGVELPGRRIIDSARVFGSVEEARRTLARAYNVPIEDIPESFSGTVVGRTLYLVSPESYRSIFRATYPGWQWDERSYHALIVHELAHRAHEEVAVTRYGSADAMGPAWFFEGLAVTCARQFETGEPPMSRSELLGHIGPGRTPEVSYPLYGRLVRSLAGSYGMGVIISRAAKSGFPEELLASPGASDADRNR